MIVGLDCSSVCIGWAILDERRKVLAVGYRKRGHGRAASFIRYVARAIAEDLARKGVRPFDPSIAIEVNAFPKKIKTQVGIHNYRVCRWAEGRLFQELGIERPIEIQASPESKEKRRARMELKYLDDLKGFGTLTQDEVDALAVADKAASDLIGR